MAINNNQPQSRRVGSGFANLQRFMQANTGNRLGQTVGQGIQQTGQQVKTGLSNAENQFNTNAEANRLDSDQNKQRVQDVLSNPINATENDIKDFSKFRAGEYAGPKALQNEDVLSGQAKEAQQLGKNVSSSGGRIGLLQRYAAGPHQYQAGQQRLDDLLLGSTGGQQLKEARRSVSGLDNQANAKIQAARNVGQQYTNLAQGFGQDVTQRTTQMSDAELNAAKTKAENANKSDAQLRDQVAKEQQLASQNQLSKEALQALGLQAGQRTYGAQLGSAIGYQGRDLLNAANPEEVMSQDDFKKFSNLRSLMGGDTQGFDASKVGSYQAGKINYDKDSLQKSISEGLGKEATEQADLDAANQINSWSQGNIDPSKKQEGIDLLNQRAKEAGAEGQPWKLLLGNDQVNQVLGQNGIGMSGPTPEQIQKLNDFALSNQNPYLNNNLGQMLITKYHPGAVTNGVTRADWAASNLQSAQQRFNDRDSQLGGVISQTPEEDLEKMPIVS